jgi:hypothetical protein
MSEQLLSGGGPTSDSDLVCPWCSAALPSADVERCPSCGAALKEPDAAVPGVTQIDVEAILKGRTPTQKPRGLIGWLSGEYDAGKPEAAPPGTLEPPDEAVRREMLRLELAALEAEVLARQVEVVTEAATESGEPVHLEELGLAETTDAAEATAADDSSGDARATADERASGAVDAPGDADAAAPDSAAPEFAAPDAAGDDAGAAPEPREG